MRTAFLSVLLALAAGCARPAPIDTRTVGKYGAPVSAGKAQPIAAVLAAPERAAAGPLLVEGKVRANCTNKGCWMELASSMDKADPGCRVTFKDYGFFVPKNSMGADARVEGAVAVRTIAADEVTHLEGEGGHFPNKLPDGSAREIRIVATGVELRK